VYELAFILFFIAFMGHSYHHIWKYWTEYTFSNFLKTVLETAAIMVLAYAIYRSKD
jgi:succinate dehydrogenase hydrophobic anchor subunit